MGSVASLDDLINRLTGGASGTPDHQFFTRLDRLQGGTAPVATVIGRWTSLWGYAGQPAGVDVAASIPGTTATAPTNTTNGALKQANPGGGRQKYLTGIEIISSQIGTYLLYDRLVQSGGLDGTVTTAQSLTSAAVTRYTTDWIGNAIWVEIYTAIGATATTITATYTREDGTTGRVTQAVAIGGAGLQEAGRMIMLPLAAGDRGVRSVQSVTLAGTTGTAGNFGVTISHPLALVPCSVQAIGFARDFVTGLPQLPEVLSGAALAFAFFAGTTVAPQMSGMAHMIEA